MGIYPRRRRRRRRCRLGLRARNEARRDQIQAVVAAAVAIRLRASSRWEMRRSPCPQRRLRACCYFYYRRRLNLRISPRLERPKYAFPPRRSRDDRYRRRRRLPIHHHHHHHHHRLFLLLLLRRRIRAGPARAQPPCPSRARRYPSIPDARRDLKQAAWATTPPPPDHSLSNPPRSTLPPEPGLPPPNPAPQTLPARRHLRDSPDGSHTQSHPFAFAHHTRVHTLESS